MRYIYICITIITLCQLQLIIKGYFKDKMWYQLMKKMEPMMIGIKAIFKSFGIDESVMEKKKPSELLQNPDDKENVN